MPDNTEFATLSYPGGELDLEIVHATEGADGIALGSLLAKTGYTTYDEGFVNTAATNSAITYIDGDAGILRYRGYPIEQLAEEVGVHRGQLPAYLPANCPPTSSWTSSLTESSGIPCCTRTSSGSSTASRATRTRCRCCPVP